MKHVITFRTKAKAERVLQAGANSHDMKFKKTSEYGKLGDKHSVYYVWYTQK